jgi:LPS O-antigen subunit length determinant protein (WzzB/FepE family)
MSMNRMSFSDEAMRALEIRDARIRALEQALKMARAECVKHNEDYHHRTSAEKLAQMDVALAGSGQTPS